MSIPRRAHLDCPHCAEVLAEQPPTWPPTNLVPHYVCSVETRATGATIAKILERYRKAATL